MARNLAGRWPARIALGCAAAAILYGVLLRIFWLPGQHTVEIDLEAKEHGLLRISPHVGRGYYPGDATEQPIRPGRRGHRADIPFQAGSVKIQLLVRPGAVAIQGVRVSGRDVPPGSRGRTDDSATSILIDKLPSHIDSIPAWGNALCLLLALIAGGVLAAVGPRLGRALAAATEPANLLTVRGALVATALAGSILLALATCADVYVVLVRHIDNPPYWPISIFDPVLPGQSALAGAALVLVGLWLAARHVLAGGQTALPVLLVAASCTVLATNALGGIERGFAMPLVEPNAYLRDAMGVRDVADFLASFTERQLELRLHSRTHPPGAVLAYVALQRGLGDPVLIAAILAIAVSTATTCFFYGIARRFADRPQALFATLLLACLPAVQIYTVSSLDALIAAMFTGVLCCFLHPDPRIRYGVGAFGLVAAAFVSFGALFLVPVLAGHELAVRRSLRTTIVWLLGAAALYLALYLATGFDWIESFRIASRRENPAGFRLLVNPGDYFFTRLEGIAEILLFAGPVVAVLCWRGLAAARREARSLWWLVLCGGLTLLAMFAAGSFKTGETARACLFIVPYLILPVAVLAGRELDRPRQLDLICLAMAQTLGMQLFGDYFW